MNIFSFPGKTTCRRKNTEVFPDLKKITVAALALILTLIYFNAPAVAAGGSSEAAEKQFFRLHIKANSDSTADQNIKLIIRDRLIAYLSENLSGSNSDSKNVVVRRIRGILPQIESLCKKTLIENGFSPDVKCSVSTQHFPYRESDGYFLPEGDYDSLTVEIGTAQGKNWWCVLYPQVCSVESDGHSVKTDISAVPEEFRIEKTGNSEPEIRYELWIVKFFRKIFS